MEISANAADIVVNLGNPMTTQTHEILKKLALVVASGVSDLGAVLPRQVSGVFNATAIAAAVGITGTTQAAPNESSGQANANDPDLDQKIEVAKNKIVIWSATGTKSAMLKAFRAINEIDNSAPIKDKLLAVAALNEHLPGYAVSYLKESLIIKADGAKPENGGAVQLGGELLDKLRQQYEPIPKDYRVAHLFRALLSVSKDGSGSNDNGATPNRSDPIDRDIAIELLKALPGEALKDFAVYHERAREALKATDPAIDKIEFKDIPLLYIGLREVDGKTIDIPSNQVVALWKQLEPASNNGIVSDARVVLSIESAFFESLTKRLDPAGVWYQDSLVNLLQGAPSNVQNSAQALLSCISSKDLQSTLKEKVLAQDSTFYTLLDNVAEKLPKEAAASNTIGVSPTPYERYASFIAPYAKPLEYEDGLQTPFEDGRYTPSDLTLPRFYARRGLHISSLNQTLSYLNDEALNEADKKNLQVLIDSGAQNEQTELGAAIQSFRSGEITKRELEVAFLITYIRNPGNQVGELLAPLVKHSLQELGFVDLLSIVNGQEKVTKDEVLEKAKSAFIKLLVAGAPESDPQALDLLRLLFRNLPGTEVQLQHGLDPLIGILKGDIHKRYPLVDHMIYNQASLLRFATALGDRSVQIITDAPIAASDKFHILLWCIAVGGDQLQQEAQDSLGFELLKKWIEDPDKQVDRVLTLFEMAKSGDAKAAAGVKIVNLLGQLCDEKPTDSIIRHRLQTISSMIVDILNDVDIPLEIRAEGAKVFSSSRAFEEIGREGSIDSRLKQTFRDALKGALDKLILDYARQPSEIIFDLLAARELFQSDGSFSWKNRRLDLVANPDVLEQHKPTLVRGIGEAALKISNTTGLKDEDTDIEGGTLALHHRLRREYERVPPYSEEIRSELLIAIGSYGHFNPVETAKYLLGKLPLLQENETLQLSVMKGLESLLLLTGRDSHNSIVAGAKEELLKLGDELIRLTAKFIEDGKSDLAAAALASFNGSSVLYKQDPEKIEKFVTAVLQSPKSERRIMLEAAYLIDTVGAKMSEKMGPINFREGPNIELQRRTIPIVEALQAEIQRSRGSDTEAFARSTKALSRLSQIFEEGEGGASLFAFLLDTDLPRVIADASDMTEEAKLNWFNDQDLWSPSCLGWSFVPQLLDVAADSKYPVDLRLAAIDSANDGIAEFDILVKYHRKDLVLVQGVSALRDKFADLASDKSLLDLRKEINWTNVDLLTELYGFWAFDNFFHFSRESDRLANSIKLDEVRRDRVKSSFLEVLDGSYLDDAPKVRAGSKYEDYLSDSLEMAWDIPEYRAEMTDRLQSKTTPYGIRSKIESLERRK